MEITKQPQEQSHAKNLFIDPALSLFRSSSLSVGLNNWLKTCVWVSRESWCQQLKKAFACLIENPARHCCLQHDLVLKTCLMRSALMPLDAYDVDGCSSGGSIRSKGRERCTVTTSFCCTSASSSESSGTTVSSNKLCFFHAFDGRCFFNALGFPSAWRGPRFQSIIWLSETPSGTSGSRLALFHEAFFPFLASPCFGTSSCGPSSCGPSSCKAAVFHDIWMGWSEPKWAALFKHFQLHFQCKLDFAVYYGSWTATFNANSTPWWRIQWASFRISIMVPEDGLLLAERILDIYDWFMLLLIVCQLVCWFTAILPIFCPTANSLNQAWLHSCSLNSSNNYCLLKTSRQVFHEDFEACSSSWHNFQEESAVDFFWRRTLTGLSSMQCFHDCEDPVISSTSWIMLLEMDGTRFTAPFCCQISMTFCPIFTG